MNENLWQPGIRLDEVEKRIIFKALQYFGNNKTKTAQSLGISIRTLRNKLHEYAGTKAQDSSTY